MLYYVYILECRDSKLYVGCTNNLKNRLLRHKKGKIFFTSTRLPVKLVFYCALKNKYLAFNFEKYLKSGSGRSFLNRRLV